MTDKEAMAMALDALETEVSIDWTNNDEFNASAEKMHEAIAALKKQLADYAMRETQRLGQEIEQEPICPKCKAEVLYECVACSSNNYPPPQRTEPPAWFPAVENILNEYGLQAIDFVADFKAAMKDAEQSQRTEPLIGCVNHDCAKCKERNT
jgi:hypothetical protein